MISLNLPLLKKLFYLAPLPLGIQLSLNGVKKNVSTPKVYEGMI